MRALPTCRALCSVTSWEAQQGRGPCPPQSSGTQCTPVSTLLQAAGLSLCIALHSFHGSTARCDRNAYVDEIVMRALTGIDWTSATYAYYTVDREVLSLTDALMLGPVAKETPCNFECGVNASTRFEISYGERHYRDRACSLASIL